MPVRMLLRLLGLLAAFALAPQAAWAACTATAGTANLGSVSSFTAASTEQGAAVTTNFSCPSGGALNLLTPNSVTATIESATNSNGTQLRLHDAVTGDYIPFVICRDSGCSPTYAIGTQITWTSTTLLGLLNLFTGPGGTMPLYMKSVPGTQVAAGTYRSVVTIRWAWDLCNVGALGACVVRDTGNLTRTIEVTLVVNRDCAITAPAVNFGSAALVGSFDPVTQSLSITCSKGAAYSVGINNGLHALGNVRRMANGTQFIAYDIFFPASSNNRWGSVGAERRSSTSATTNPGSHTGSTAQGFAYRAEVTAGQATPPGGTYTDTLMLDVQF